MIIEMEFDGVGDGRIGLDIELGDFVEFEVEKILVKDGIAKPSIWTFIVGGLHNRGRAAKHENLVCAVKNKMR